VKWNVVSFEGLPVKCIYDSRKKKKKKRLKGRRRRQ
jgi:hypothetical protein